MKFIEAREMILTRVYRKTRGPGVWANTSTFLSENFAADEHPVAELVLNDLVAKNLLQRSSESLSLTMEGCYEAERLGDKKAYPQSERAGNYISLYSVVIATYLALVLAIPSGLNIYLFEYCQVNNFNTYLAPEWCRKLFWSNGLGRPNTFHSVIVSHLFWMAILGFIAVYVLRKVTRSWKRAS
jgi:hypothetical protein